MEGRGEGEGGKGSGHRRGKENSYLVWIGCAAQISKPLPIFKGHFGRKRYQNLEIFLEKHTHFLNFLVVAYTRKFSSSQKTDPCLGIFLLKMGPMFKVLKKKKQTNKKKKKKKKTWSIRAAHSLLMGNFS